MPELTLWAVHRLQVAVPESVLSLPCAQCENALGFLSQWCWSWGDSSLMSNAILRCWNTGETVWFLQFTSLGVAWGCKILMPQLLSRSCCWSSVLAGGGLCTGCPVLVGVAAQGFLLEVWHPFVFHQAYPVFLPVSNAYHYFCSSHGETCSSAWRSRTKWTSVLISKNPDSCCSQSLSRKWPALGHLPWQLWIRLPKQSLPNFHSQQR